MSTFKFMRVSDFAEKLFKFPPSQISLCITMSKPNTETSGHTYFEKKFQDETVHPLLTLPRDTVLEFDLKSPVENSLKTDYLEIIQFPLDMCKLISSVNFHYLYASRAKPLAHWSIYKHVQCLQFLTASVFSDVK